MNEGSNYEVVCPWCPFGLQGSLSEVHDEVMYHLRQEHYERMIDYWLENGDVSERMMNPQRYAVKHFGVDLVSNDPQEVECPFCDYTPSVEEDLDPWVDTLFHIADEHWDEFIEWADETYDGFTLAMHEEAFDTVMKEEVEMEEI